MAIKARKGLRNSHQPLLEIITLSQLPSASVTRGSSRSDRHPSKRFQLLIQSASMVKIIHSE
jgi:hypothetical protein